jgi:hypothetical protein
MPRRVVNVRCPTCRKIVLQKEPDFPFCSARCRLIDLGKWASGAYRIPTTISESDELGEGEYPASEQDLASRKRKDGGER